MGCCCLILFDYADFSCRFNPAEMLFLTEWANTMRPVAKVLDILQAETNTQLGWLLPSVHQLSLKLQRLHHSLRYCDPLVDALQQGIQTRFKHMFEDPEIIAAAILLPKFRTSWTNDETIIKRGKWMQATYTWRILIWATFEPYQNYSFIYLFLHFLGMLYPIFGCDLNMNIDVKYSCSRL